jgi:hypothetical protein
LEHAADLEPGVAGILEKVRVSEGDRIGKGTAVAIVGGQEIHAASQGIVISVMNTPGQWVTSSTPIVKMIDPKEFRVIGHIDEDKGLADIKPGQHAVFTVDASETFVLIDVAHHPEFLRVDHLHYRRA